MRTTIDFGIDLGTTNSTIAVLRGLDVDVFKNNEGFEYTPSAVWIDKNQGLRVGRRAKERLEDDRENAFCEFKLQMGTSNDYAFTRSGRRMKPEELSAEVLKSLKADVKQRSGDDVEAAVITVPAAFELPQCEATKRAAQLAGFALSPLLQEPVAAALSYGFQSEKDKVFWLVYDFGGGTFDAAVIQMRDGVISVVNHAGDNHLGGKLIDWEIVDQLLLPAASREHALRDFNRTNPKWNAAIAKLKLKAEEAKIRLSREESVEIIVDYLCQDDRGEPVRFEHDLKRQDVERLIEPFVTRSVNICKKALSEKHLGAGNIEKVILVGGPTLTPYIRERLQGEIGIPLEFSVDPLTIVARGAAVFAGTQRLEGVARPAPVSAGQYAIALQYNPMGAETEPLVGGVVQAPGNPSLAGFTIEFVNSEAKPPWRSGKVGLAPNGSFMANLWAEKGRLNTFEIELSDATGVRRETAPARLTYTVATVFNEPPLINSVGIALANNEMAWLVSKGTPLPARKRDNLRTVTPLRRGDSGNVVRIPVMEGQSSRADRNQIVGTLEINAANIKRDVPAGSEVEVTIEVDQSRLVTARAYVPVLDEEFEHVINYKDYGARARNASELRKELEGERKRLDQAREKTGATGDAKARQALQRIDAERMIHDAEAALNAAQADRDAADKCAKRILDLRSAIDEVEDALEWPALVAEAEKETKDTRELMSDKDFKASDEQRSEFKALEREIRGAIESKDGDLLRRKVKEMSRLGFLILTSNPATWVAFFQNLEKKQHTMSDRGQAEIYIAQGRRAIQNDDIDSLQSAVRQLLGLLPADDADRAGIISGVMR